MISISRWDRCPQIKTLFVWYFKEGTPRKELFWWFTGKSVIRISVIIFLIHWFFWLTQKTPLYQTSSSHWCGLLGKREVIKMCVTDMESQRNYSRCCSSRPGRCILYSNSMRYEKKRKNWLASCQILQGRLYPTSALTPLSLAYPTPETM